MEIPAPTPSDPEDVATALETAAIFAKKGDVPEATRWLGRAADLASLSGDGARAETIARCARSLSGSRAETSELEAVPDRRLPTPPPKRVSRPPAPSERPGEDHASQPMLLVRPASSTPVAPAVRAQAQTAIAAAPRPSSVPSAKEHQEISTVRESSVRPAPFPKPLELPHASTPPKPVDVVKPAEAAKPSARPSLHHDLHRPFRLQGARVSLAPSQGSSRYYVLKVLEDGERVADGEHEAFLVLADPNAAR